MLKTTILKIPQFEKALDGGIIVRIALTRHADLEAMIEQCLRIVVGSILDATDLTPKYGPY